MMSRAYSEKNQLYDIFSTFHQYFHQCSWTSNKEKDVATKFRKLSAIDK